MSTATICLPKTFQGLVENLTTIPFKFEGVDYALAELKFPSGKTIIFGLNGEYVENSIFQIMKTLKKPPTDCCLAELGNNKQMVFKYETERGQKFLIIRGSKEQALTTEEKELMWDLLQ